MNVTQIPPPCNLLAERASRRYRSFCPFAFRRSFVVLFLAIALFLAGMTACIEGDGDNDAKTAKGGGDDEQNIDPAEFITEDIKAGYAIFSYKVPSARKLGFLVTARGDAAPDRSEAEQIATDFLGDPNVHGGYYRRTFIANQTRDVFISMTDKAGRMNSASDLTTDMKNAWNLLSVSRNQNNTSTNGVLLVPGSRYTLHVYDYLLNTVSKRDFATKNETEFNDSTTDIELPRGTKTGGAGYLKEPPVLSAYIEDFTNPAAFSRLGNPYSTCTIVICSPHTFEATSDAVLNTKVYHKYHHSNNFVMVFITGDETADTFIFAHGSRKRVFNVAYD